MTMAKHSKRKEPTDPQAQASRPNKLTIQDTQEEEEKNESTIQTETAMVQNIQPYFKKQSVGPKNTQYPA